MTRDQAVAIARALRDGKTVERAMLAAGYARSTARRGTVSDCGCTTGFRVRRVSPRRHPAVIFAALRLRVAPGEQQPAALRHLSSDMLAMRAAGVGTAPAERMTRLVLGIGHGLSVREAMLQAGYSAASAQSGQVTHDGLRQSAARHSAVVARMDVLRSTPGRGLALDPLPRSPTRRQRRVLPCYIAHLQAEAAMLAAGYAESTARAGRLSTAGGDKVPPMSHPAVHAAWPNRDLAWPTVSNSA